MDAMKTTITFVFESDDATAVADITHAVDLGQLLHDAMGEFTMMRTPAKEYVMKRYPDIDRTRIAYKTREVEKRCLLADLLRKADVTIEVEDVDS